MTPTTPAPQAPELDGARLHQLGFSTLARQFAAMSPGGVQMTVEALGPKRPAPLNLGAPYPRFANGRPRPASKGGYRNTGGKAPRNRSSSKVKRG